MTLPAHNLEIEEALLGYLLRDPRGLDRVPDLQVEHFYKPAHRDIYAAIAAVAEQGDVPEPVMVTAELERRHLVDVVGGPNVLNQLLDKSGPNPAGYARDLAELAKVRRIQSLGDELRGADVATAGALIEKTLEQLWSIDLPDGPDAAIVQAVADELGLEGPDALRMAHRVQTKIVDEQSRLVARRRVRDAEAERLADLDAIEVGTAAQLLAVERETQPPLLGEFMLDGHNLTVTAKYKAGKSTFLENVTASCVAARPFLGRYEIHRVHRVAYLNYELTAADMDARIVRLGLNDRHLERLLVANLRGHHLPLMTPVGRDWLVQLLADHQADVVIVDTWGAALAAAGVESENDNAEGRRFLLALDDIKRRAGTRSLVMSAHTGRGDQTEGNEHARGMTVLDDWADVRAVLTRNDNGDRFLYTDGRATPVPESRLTYNGRDLTLGDEDLGYSRRKERETGHVQTVAKVVAAQPGLTSTDLRAAVARAGITNGQQAGAAQADAINHHLIHRHAAPKGRAQHHYAGPPHEDHEPCQGGWTSDHLPNV